MNFHAVIGDVESYIGHVKEVIGEVLLDDIALVAATNHEVVDSVVRINLHDVPKDGLAANFDHRLGLEVGFLGNTGAQAAGKNDCFHFFGYSTFITILFPRLSSIAAMKRCDCVAHTVRLANQFEARREAPVLAARANTLPRLSPAPGYPADGKDHDHSKASLHTQRIRARP